MDKLVPGKFCRSVTAGGSVAEVALVVGFLSVRFPRGPVCSLFVFSFLIPLKSLLLLSPYTVPFPSR